MNMANTEFLCDMPYYTLSNFELYNELQSVATKYYDLFKENNLYNLIKNNLPHEVTSSIECKYYSDEDFAKVAVGTNNKFSAFHINLQSSYKNLQLLRGNLMNIKYQFKVIALTETGNRTSQQLQSAFPGYKIFFSPPSKAKGGVATMVHEDTFSKVQQIHEFSSDDPDIESLWLKLSSNNNTTIIGSIYRHPGTCMDKFESYLSMIFNQMTDRRQTLIIMAAESNMTPSMY